MIGDDEEEWDRLIRVSSGVPYVLLVAGCALVWTFNGLLTAIARKRINERSRKIKDSEKDEDEGKALAQTFTAMHPMIKAHGLDSYNIMKNKKYRPLIQALDSAAAKIKELAMEGPEDQASEAGLRNDTLEKEEPVVGKESKYDDDPLFD